jgi:hypothetical protein
MRYFTMWMMNSHVKVRVKSSHNGWRTTTHWCFWDVRKNTISCTSLQMKDSDNWSDDGFNELIQLLRDFLPKDNVLPQSTYQAKKIVLLSMRKGGRKGNLHEALPRALDLRRYHDYQYLHRLFCRKGQPCSKAKLQLSRRLGWHPPGRRSSRDVDATGDHKSPEVLQNDQSGGPQGTRRSQVAESPPEWCHPAVDTCQLTIDRALK